MFSCASQAHDAQPMTHDSSSLVDVSRRDVLRKTGGGLAAAGGGAVVAFGLSGPGSANVSLDIPDAEHEGEDGTVKDITVTTTGNYQFSTNAATTVLVSLLIASEPDAGDWGVIDTQEDNVLAASSSGQYELGGSVLDHDQLEASVFSADAAETTTRQVPVKVAADVMYDGEAVATATARSTVTVEVTSTAVAVSAEVSGSGNVEIAV